MLLLLFCKNFMNFTLFIYLNYFTACHNGPDFEQSYHSHKSCDRSHCFLLPDILAACLPVFLEFEDRKLVLMQPGQFPPLESSCQTLVCSGLH